MGPAHREPAISTENKWRIMQEWMARKEAAGKHGTKAQLEASRQVLLLEAFEHVGIESIYKWETGTGKRSKKGSRHGVHTYTAKDVRYWRRGRSASSGNEGRPLG